MRNWYPIFEKIREKYIGETDERKCRRVSFEILDRVRISCSNVYFIRTTQHPSVGEHALVVFEDESVWVAVDATRNQLGYEDGIKVTHGNSAYEAVANLGYDPSIYNEQILHKESYIRCDLRYL